MIKLVFVLVSVTLVLSHDVDVGQRNIGRKIYSEDRKASPAIWRQSENVIINATDNEVISAVFVTDQRPDKDGDVRIVEGGLGHKNVTLELKSPTVLRGFDFHIDVYVAPEGQVNVDASSPIDPQTPKSPSQTWTEGNPKDISTKDESYFTPPGVISNDEPLEITTKSDLPMTKDININENNNNSTDPYAESVEGKFKPNDNSESNTKDFEKNAPVTDNQDRLVRDTQKTQGAIFDPKTVSNDHNTMLHKSNEKAPVTTETVEISSTTTKPDDVESEADFTDTTQAKMLTSTTAKNYEDMAIEPENNDDVAVIPVGLINNDKAPIAFGIDRKVRDTDNYSTTKAASTGNDNHTPKNFPTVNNDQFKTSSPLNGGGNQTNEGTNTAIPRSYTPLPYTNQDFETSTAGKWNKAFDMKSPDNKVLPPNLPRLFGEQNITNTEPKPVISIQ